MPHFFNSGGYVLSLSDPQEARYEATRPAKCITLMDTPLASREWQLM